MTVALPPSYDYGLVVGRVIHAVADSTDDADRTPEARPASGTVRFEPTDKLRKILVPPTTFVGHETVVATLGPTGELLDAEGEVGIWLVAGTYNVTFSIVGATIPSFSIEVTAAHTALSPLDLVTASPYIAPAPVPVNLIEVPAGATAGTVLGWDGAGPMWRPDPAAVSADEASASADLAAGSASSAAASATAAQTARTGAETAKTAAETARAGAETAKTAAVAAQGHAETAQGITESARDDAIQAKEAVESFGFTATAEHVSSDTPVSVEVTGAAPTFNLDINIPRGRDAYIESATPPADTNVLWLDTGTPSLPESGSPFELRGYGMPNGVVTAIPGTYYTDVVGTNGAWRWLKTSGTGNTGWVVVLGDTGWRNVASLLINGWTAALTEVKLRRAGSVVELMGMIYGSGRTSDRFLDIPSGFNPTVPSGTSIRVPGSYQGYFTSDAPVATRLSGSGLTMSTSGTPQFRYMWLTHSDWPTTLPGTAV